MGFATDFSVTVYCDFCRGQTEEITRLDTTSYSKAWAYAKSHGWTKHGDRHACPKCTEKIQQGKIST